MSLLDIPRSPPLSREAEDSLVLRWQKRRDKQALDILIRTHIRLFRKYALMYRTTLDVEDAFTEALFGFVKALDRYRPNKGASLGSYGQLWIRAALQKLHVKEKCRGKTGDLMTSPCKHNLVMRNIARERTLCGWNEDKDQFLGIEFNLDMPLGPEGEATYYDVISKESYVIEDELVRGDTSRRLETIIEEALSTLPEDLRFVLERRCMASPMWTLQEVGESLGVSREAARQKETKAKRLVRSVLLSNKDKLNELWPEVNEAVT